MKHWNIILAFLAHLTICVSADEYFFGDGYQIGESPVSLGGYVSTNYIKEREKHYVNIDEVALLVYGEYDQFAFLGEVESSDFYDNDTNDHNPHFHTERFYVDYFIEENQRLRVGQFNSDIGFWMQMPINVLRDTTANPRFTEDFLPKLLTGLNYEYQHPSHQIERLSLSMQISDDMDPKYNNFATHRHYCVAMDMNRDDWLWKFAGGYFKYNQLHHAFYLTGSAKMETKEWTTIVESVIRQENNDKISYDIYAQRVWHWIERHHLIMRAEIEKTPVYPIYDHSLTLGYAYRPIKNIALKAEYEVHDDAALTRGLFSFSVLF